MYLHTLIPHKSSQQEMSHIFPFNLGLFQPSKNQKITEKETEREREREKEEKKREREREREGGRETEKKKTSPFPCSAAPGYLSKPFSETSAPGCLEDSSHHDFNARTLLKHRSIGILPG